MARVRCTTTRLCLSVLLAIVVVQFVLFYRFLEVEWISGKRSEFGDFENGVPVLINIEDHAPPNKKRDYRQKKAETVHQADSVHKVEMKTHSQKVTQKVLCTVQGEEAKSALRRARTAECRDELTRVACLHESNTLYWRNITRSCPVPDNPAKDLNITHKKPLPGMPKVRILFVLTVHGRAVRQVCRLFKRLYHRDQYYLIHVDSRSNYMFSELSHRLKHFPNVELLNWRMATIWGGASLLQMLLRTMAEALHKVRWHWDFFINLSESDYLIKPLPDLVDFLTAWHDRNFLRGHGGYSPKFTKKQGLDQTFHECDKHMWRVGPRRLPEGIHIDGGSDWIIVNRRYARYLIYSKDPLLLGLKQLFKYSLLPAESFFHTVLRNSEQCQTFVKHNLHLTNWNRKLGCRCQYRHIVDWCGCSPNNFLMKDFTKLKEADGRFFARKFEAVVNMAIVNVLDVFVFGNWPPGTPALTSYWESLYHFDDGGESYSDQTMTTYHSFVRQMSSAVKMCTSPESVSHLVEVTLLRVNDIFDSLLARASFSLDDGTELILEGQFTPITSTVIQQLQSLPLSRVKTVNVGTDWDKKEYIYRNYPSIFGIMAEPVITFHLEAGAAFKLHGVVFSPTGKIVKNHTFVMQGHWVIAEFNLQLERPLHPGLWQVKLFHESAEFANVVFVVPPREIHDQTQVSEVKFNKIHNNVALPANAQGGSFTERLQAWTDMIVSNAWKLKDICSVQSKSCAPRQLCVSTSWSSLSPDPKSAFGPIRTDGLLS